MKFQHNYSLKTLNTFGIDVKAKSFIKARSEKELIEILKDTYPLELFILSGGSNMLLTKDISATVIHIAIKGIEVIHDEKDSVLIQVKAGENWHEFVQFCIQNNYGGLENLSLIPGYVGSAPIQNIGAYGVELKDTFVSCTTIRIKDQKKMVFSKEDCKFGYRDSIFKNSLKGQHIITNVTFRLSKNRHELKMSYGAIQSELSDFKNSEIGIKEIAEAVIAIRKSKLPDPKEIGNSGSFFKNPVINMDHFKKLLNENPEMPSYKINDNSIKVPAGWLIEKCGFKGKRYGDAGVHEKQALVLVNHGNANGNEIKELSNKIKEEVFKEFNIKLETEVNIF